MGRPRAGPYDAPYSRYARFQDYGYEDDFDCDDPAKIYMRGQFINNTAFNKFTSFF